MDPEQARAMVRVREARRAYRRFHAQCFWSSPPDLEVGPDDIAWVAEHLRRHGGREAWEKAANRSEESYLAGGAAILAEPKRRRFSHDLDYFHDSAARVVEGWRSRDAARVAARLTSVSAASTPGSTGDSTRHSRAGRG